MPVKHNNKTYCLAYGPLPQPTQKYISPTQNAIWINPAPNYTVKNTTRLKYTFVPGTWTGDCFIGNMGTTSPETFSQNDSNDFRFISWNGGSNNRLDVRNQESIRPDTHQTADTPQITVEFYDYGISIWDKNGDLIESKSGTSSGTWDSNVPIYVWPADSRGIFSNMKIYDVKITDDILGTIYDGKVDGNGLYDAVSQSYTIITGWEVHTEPAS